MHSEVASIVLTSWAEGFRFRPGPPPGSSVLQADWADWNAGDWGLTPEPAVIWTPPPDPGSGKFGTPCARMQSANLMPCEANEGVEPLEPFESFESLEEPHAPMASAQPIAASAIDRWPPRWLVMSPAGLRWD
jgi:hypothetical protein